MLNVVFKVKANKLKKILYELFCKAKKNTAV